MASRRGLNHTPDPESPRPDSPSPDEQSTSEPDESSDSPLPFYNTTFSAHRVSRLYVGREPLTASRLRILSQRLRERLIGDVVRGVEVGLGPDGDDPVMGRAGPLESVEMRWVSVAAVLGISQERGDQHLGPDGMELEGEDADDRHRTASELHGAKALQVSLRYETASCTALLLPSLKREENKADAAHTRFSVASVDDMDWEQSVDPGHFLSLPLLLLRMPAPLKTIIGDFLSTTFDCRVSPMRLGTRSLVRSWEAWITTAGVPSRGPLGKDVVISLGFHVPPAPDKMAASSRDEVTATSDHQLGLKSIDVIIPASELRWRWEEDLKERRRLAGRFFEEGWGWRAATGGDGGEAIPVQQPFTEALACYLKEHLGLNLFHPGVRVIKIACGGFAMSEGRLKVFAPTYLGEAGAGQRSAVLELLRDLAEKAQVRIGAT
ncbi:Kinetochore complex Sim4 subunit Fta1-domain-containing protein [Madurella fahalii]|uniref:Kinetochore complex Sim4 subunit Fta1-domain-containing protein n=1 Tax=Madurella fahalii TaxID=1157608 RepID=A0ABQ0GKY6_9PEZI